MVINPSHIFVAVLQRGEVELIRVRLETAPKSQARFQVGEH